MKIDRNQAKTITNEIQDAIAGILASHGLTQDKINTKYGDIYRITIEASIHEVNGNGVNVNSREMENLKYYAQHHGIADIEADLAGETIHYGGKEWIPVGYKPRATKRPFIMKNVQDGKEYVFPDSIAAYFPSYDGKGTEFSYSRDLPKPQITVADPFAS